MDLSVLNDSLKDILKKYNISKKKKNLSRSVFY